MCNDTNEIILSNTDLTLRINAHGAELCSIRHHDTEYLWQADPAFWKRHSPVLFPIVGSLWEGRYRVEGREYSLSQHGFARDMQFTLLSHTSTEAHYMLSSDETTRAKYPYDFRLEIGYRIEGQTIRVMWTVENPADRTLDFQIGAHPAFFYRNPQENLKGYFSFDTADELQSTLIGEKGSADIHHKETLRTDSEGLLPITDHTFDRDALILEHSQIKQVTLHDTDRRPCLRMTFDAPLVGLWAPGALSPFVCIEPWYGRCDRTGFAGEFKDRDWMQHLAPQDTFHGGYTIEIL